MLHPLPRLSSPQAYGLFLNETTTAQHLKTLGYQTHALGKWHLGLYNWLYTPTFRGFDSFYGCECCSWVLLSAAHAIAFFQSH